MFYILCVWSASHNRRSDPLQTIQHESAGSIPGTRGYVTTSSHPCTSTITSVTTTVSPSPAVTASPMAKPVPFSSVAEECNSFLLQCSRYIENQPYLYPTEKSKISFLISLLSGKALQWAETIWSQSGSVTKSFDNFVNHFREVFGRAYGDPTAGDQLYHLRQGSLPIKEYALKFRTLAAASGWDERSLITTYHHGLEPKLCLQMAGYDDSYGLENMIQHSIHCSFCMQSCFEESSTWYSCTPPHRYPEPLCPPEPETEPMLTENMQLSSAERQRRLTKGLCLNCGGGGHVISVCPTRPPRFLVSAIQPIPQNMPPFSIVVTLIAPNVSLPVHALLDSGSAGNFISGSLCRQLKIRTTINPKTYQVQSVTGKSTQPSLCQTHCWSINITSG